MLHAVHAIEKFLAGLIRRNCNFHLAFFDEHKDLCIPYHADARNWHKFLLTRETFIRHMQVSTEQRKLGCVLYLFRSIHSNDFNEYLAKADVYFFMCHDGASLPTLNLSQSHPYGMNRLIDPSRAALGITIESGNGLRHHRCQKTGLRFIIYEFTRRGYGVALINGLEWKDSKVFWWPSSFTHTSPLPLTFVLPLPIFSSDHSNLYDTCTARLLPFRSSF